MYAYHDLQQSFAHEPTKVSKLVRPGLLLYRGAQLVYNVMHFSVMKLTLKKLNNR